MELTIAICTRNRAQSLRRALQSFSDQDAATNRFELLVVDNGSTDDTAAMLSTFSLGGVRLRSVSCAEVGTSHARNRAVDAAEGALIGFVDDDVTVDRTFASSILAAFNDDASLQAIGGRIDLDWAGARPAWLPVKFETFFARLDLGVGREIRYPVTPFGANMAFRREALRRVGGFSPLLGPDGGRMRFNEETAVFQALAREQLKVAFDPRVRVLHHVPNSRTTVRHFIRRMFAQGSSDAALDAFLMAPNAPAPARQALKRITGIVSCVRIFGGLVVRGEVTAARSLEQLANAVSHLGYVYGVAVGLSDRRKRGNSSGVGR